MPTYDRAVTHSHLKHDVRLMLHTSGTTLIAARAADLQLSRIFRVMKNSASIPKSVGKANTKPESGAHKQTPTNARSRKSVNNAADQILKQIGELTAQVAVLTEQKHAPSAPQSEAAGLEQLLETLLHSCRSDIDEKSDSLMLRMGAALDKHQDAIAAIADSIQPPQQTSSADVQPAVVKSDSPRRSDMAQCRNNPEKTSSPEKTKADASDSSWDQIRNAFMLENSQTEEATQTESTATAISPPEPADWGEPNGPEDDFVFRNDYTPADTSEMNEEQLRSALLDQERVISILVGQLQRKFRSRQTLNAVQLRELKSSLPDETAVRIDQSLKALDQQVRLGELELSLERARVSRQLSHLEETRCKLESNAKTLGFTIGADGRIEGRVDAAVQGGTKGRRWLGVLGFGN